MNILRYLTVKIVQEILCYDTLNDKNKDTMISKIVARAIKGEAEFAFLGAEFASTEEIKPVICDGGAPLRSLHCSRIAQTANPRQLRSRQLKEGLL